jgi:hypothetical protein
MASVTGREPHEWNGVLCSFDWMSREQVARLIVAYNEVTRSGHPHMEDVRALVEPENSEPSWIPYRRLLLPVHDSEGRPLIVCFSEVREDIGIPFMGRAA